MTKYYTPAFYEFTPNLRYQYRLAEQENWEDAVFTRDDFKVDNCFSKMHEIMNELEKVYDDRKIHYRIKLLDHDDIIEAGFTKTTPIYIHNAEYNTYINKEQYELTHYSDGKQSTILVSDKHSNVLFNGIVMNFQELQEILERIEVDEPTSFKFKLRTLQYED